MNWILCLALFSTPLFALPEKPAAQGLSGNYKLAYLATDLVVGTRGEDQKESAESFDYKKIAKPPIPEPFYMLHDPKGPTATLIGAGSDSPRLCEGEASLLSQELNCTALSKETWVDKDTQCGIKKVFVETILYSIVDELRYGRTEVISFDKSTEEGCAAYKKNLAEQLNKNEGPDFFKAMKEAGLLKNMDNLPDFYLMTHFYQATLTEDKAVETPENSKTGAYSLKYSGKSKTLSWMGKEKKDMQESQVFNAREAELSVPSLDNILLFHDPDKNSARVAGGGLNKVRKCELESENKETSEEVFLCTLFKANEEELGTGCSIEHWVQEKITLSPKEAPRYERLEQRHLQESTQEGCEQYRKKISEELKDGTAELFFRVLANTGGLNPKTQLGDTFQVVHEYSVKADD